jgi:hypothetical protein
MKILFFSSDDSEVQRLKQELDAAGIACEIRGGLLPDSNAQPELWIQDERDCYRALMLCTQLGLGFARRAERLPTRDLEMELEFLPD